MDLKRVRRIPEGAWWIASIVGVLVSGVLASWWFWDELRQFPQDSLSTTVRNLALVIGGVIAMLLAMWRSRIAERQSLASQHQADTAQQSLLNERYERGAEMLGSEVLSVRLGGISALQKLALEHPVQYHVQVIRLLCAFVRNPAGIVETPQTEGGRRYPRLRDDVQAAMSAISYRSEICLDLERNADDFRLDLYGANLLSAKLSGANLRGANLTNANLEGASLTSADLSDANLSGANLCRAHLGGANISGANLIGAPNLTWIMAGDADFSETNIGSADFSHAYLTHANLSGANITATEFAQASLFNTNLSGVRFGEATRVTMSDPPVSENLYVRLTQEQLDRAAAEPDNPPKIHECSVDVVTGKPLVWRGSKPLVFDNHTA